MGPQLDSCGRLREQGHRDERGLMLQWGRNLTVAEGTPAAPGYALRSLLQWGRNLTVAEGGDVSADTQSLLELQWGRNLTVAEGA